MLKPDIFIGEEKGEGILFDPHTLNTLWLNDTAVEIITRLKQNMSKTDIINDLHEIYDEVEIEELNKDFDELIRKLKENSFLGE